MRTLQYALAFCLSALAAPQAMACFTVYDRVNKAVYSGTTPPIDMSYQIHEKLPAAFPGGHMVFGTSPDCPDIDTRKVSPQLTNVAAAPAGHAAARKPRARPGSSS